MKFLKMKLTRIIAFFAACILTAYCAYSASGILMDYERYGYPHAEADDSEFGRLMTELWAVGNMYLRNLDENGKFKGSDDLKKSTEKAMQDLGIMDYDGNIVIHDEGYFDYYVSYGSQEFSNTDKNFNENFNPDYSCTYERGIFSHMSNMYNFWYPDNLKWYSTNYGMYYYNLGEMLNMSAVAVYDYDTTNLDCYIDDRGVKIYYKTDGSTPLPFMEDDGYYNTNAEEGYDDIIAAEVNMEVPENGYLIYNSENGKWVKVDKELFVNLPGDLMPLKICITPVDSVIQDYEAAMADYNSSMKDMARSLANLIPIAVVILVLLVFFWATGGYSIKEGKCVTGSFEKWFTEIPLVLAAVFIVCGCGLVIPDVMVIFKDFFCDVYNRPQLIPAAYAAAYAVIVGLTAAMLNSVFIRLKCHCFWKTSLTGKIIGSILGKIKKYLRKAKEASLSRQMIKNNLIVRRFVLRLAKTLAAAFILFMFCFSINSAELIFICGIVIFAGYIYFSFKDLKYLTKMEQQISDMNGGDYSKKEVPENAVTYAMTEKLNNISDGIQAAVERQIKSERMKIELVTNVSHDLKTPLTSIISYIDLLSKEELEPAASDYVRILEQKSERLKAIVSDLFDLAKASSRTDMEMERLDTVILVNQVIGDMNDKIENSGKEIRTNINIAEAAVYADGRKMYRVLQNLIDNSLKYSLDGTRIWLSLNVEEENAVIRLKNISSYEMQFSPEEITERFTRGDESRTSEGNGLGLSIAKSFTEACGGRFDIIIDGDMFIAEVRLPIAG